MSDEFTASYNSKDATVLQDLELVANLEFLEINQLKIDRGLAMQDLIGGVYEYVDSIAFQPHARIYLLDHLATIEYVSYCLLHHVVLSSFQASIIYRRKRKTANDRPSGYDEECR